MTNKQNITVGKTFKSEFLENYILVLVGALIKKDTDAWLRFRTLKAAEIGYLKMIFDFKSDFKREFFRSFKINLSLCKSES